ncbi:hypothetical protein ACHAXS_014242 [Conticribra weissflogii]
MTAKKASRLGVGASNSTNNTNQENKNLPSKDWTATGKKKILSIGKKRRGHEDDDDEDTAILKRNNGHDSDDGDGEEEGGRTSIVSERKRKVPRENTNAVSAPATSVHGVDEEVPPSPEAKSKKKRKKKGKKEREVEKDATAPSALNDVDDSPANVNNIKESNQNGTDESIPAPTEILNKNNNKRKRKKIRSRQKNIRKDTRAANDKPSYLVLGRSDYAGRPLTKATRDILKKKNKEDDVGNDENNWTKGNWTTGDIAAAEESGDKGGMTAGSEESVAKNDGVAEVKSSETGNDKKEEKQRNNDTAVKLSKNQDEGQPLNSTVSKNHNEDMAEKVGKDVRKKKKRKFKNLTL